jgi:hypothetical protein
MEKGNFLIIKKDDIDKFLSISDANDFKYLVERLKVSKKCNETVEGVRVEISCHNTKCKSYWEDMCLMNWRENQVMFHDSEGKCTHYENGINEAYEQNDEESQLCHGCLMPNVACICGEEIEGIER